MPLGNGQGFNQGMRQVLIYPDPESDYWIAEVPSLRGCVSQGRSRAEALRNIREAIEGWIEVAEAEGWDVPPDMPELEVQGV